MRLIALLVLLLGCDDDVQPPPRADAGAEVVDPYGDGEVP